MVYAEMNQNLLKKKWKNIPACESVYMKAKDKGVLMNGRYFVCGKWPERRPREKLEITRLIFARTCSYYV